MNRHHLTILSITASALMITACGKKDEAPAPAPAPAATEPAPAPAPTTAPAPAPDAAVADAGKATYNKTCALCHSAGVGGAPKSGDKADWGPRIAQGKDVLYKHAIEGYTGQKGMMPAKGGNTALTDDEVKAAVDYQVSINQ